MARFSLDKMKRLSRSHGISEHMGQEEATMERTSAEAPPPYAEVVGDSQSADLLRSGDPAARSTISPSYRQTDRPPEYQCVAEGVQSQPLTQTISPAPHDVHMQHGDRTLTQALSRAALAGKVDVVRALLEAGAELYELSAIRTTSAVHSSLRGPNPELALLLLDHPCEGTYQGSLSRVGFLLSVKDEQGCTPLHLAASAGASDVVREMLELGASVDAVDVLGRTPLHMAARYGRVDVMDVLLEHGADAALVHEGLWVGTRPDAQRELGDCMFVRRSIAKSLQKRQGHGSKHGEDMGDEKSHLGEKTTRSYGSKEGISLSNKASFDALTLPPAFVNRQTRPGPRQASKRGLFGPHLTVPVGHRPNQRAPDSVLFSPQYARWSSMCEQIQEEHRQQKERNAASGIGGGGLY